MSAKEVKTDAAAAGRSPFHKRGFVSLLTFAGFVAMGFTGLVAYIMPEGRVAYWTDWRLLTLTKYDWGDMHVLTSIMFLAAGSFHLYFNWKPFTNYVAGKAKAGLKYKRELAATTVLTVFVLASSIYEAPPLSYVLKLNDYIKQSWVKGKEYEPPFGHAEQLSLKVFAKKMNIPLEEAVAEFEVKGIKVASIEDTLEEIARDNDTSPMDLYMLIRKFEKKEEPSALYTPESVEEKFAGMGVGRMTLDWLIEDVNIAPAIARRRLAASGLDVREGETIKMAAERHGMNPIEIVKFVLVEGYRPEKSD